jgi:hypothetical protein
MIERPLVFIPGIYLSTLAINDNTFWPPSEFSSSTVRDVLDKLGTNIRTTVGKYAPVVAKDLFPLAYDINSMSSSWGYTPDNFWTFPYDWRQSNNISGKMLADFIKNKIHGTNWDGVDVVCHSMGGLVVRTAIMNQCTYQAYNIHSNTTLWYSAGILCTKSRNSHLDGIYSPRFY